VPTERDLLVSALRHLGGAAYDSSAPYAAGSLDCVRFTYAVLKDLWPDVAPAIHDELHLLDPSQPFSPVEAVDNAGLSGEWSGLVRPGRSSPIPGCWHLCQGWKSLDPLERGHGWFWYEPATPLLEAGLLVQATNAQYPWVLPMHWGEQVAKFPHTRVAVLALNG
jgi:hypothetical protein